jgi:hypothetical protein
MLLPVRLPLCGKTHVPRLEKDQKFYGTGRLKNSMGVNGRGNWGEARSRSIGRTKVIWRGTLNATGTRKIDGKDARSRSALGEREREMTRRRNAGIEVRCFGRGMESGQTLGCIHAYMLRMERICLIFRMLYMCSKHNIRLAKSMPCS